MPLAADSPCGGDAPALCEPIFKVTRSGWLAEHAEAAVGTPARILLIIVVALVVRALLHRAIRRFLRGTGTKSRKRPDRNVLGLAGLAGPSERRAQRAQTIGSILRSSTAFVVFAIAFVMILGELDVELGPILASAGIVGVALGFGAQSLVGDFLAGIFMILEDQYGVGDIVDVGEATGTVEEVGLRATRLRDINGTVWYVRNGEMRRIGNMSQGYAKVVLDLPFPAATDIDRARDVISRIAADMWREDEWSEVITERPDMQGMTTLTRQGIDLRLVVTTKPNEQWRVGRELRARLVDGLERENLPVAFAKFLFGGGDEQS